MKNSAHEQQLLSQMAGNDRSAFEAIYRSYWTALYDAACRRLKNSAQAEDIVQNIFIRLWDRRAMLQVNDLSAYLHAAVRYSVYNYIMRDAVPDAFYEPFETIAAYPVNADETVIEKDLLHLMNAYIAALPPKRKQIFALYFDENLSTREIAKRLKISRKTVQNQLGAAMHGLRSQLISTIILILFMCRI